MKKMDKKNKRIIYFILVLIWMITVFLFSNQNGEESKNTSDSTFTDNIVEVVTNNLKHSNKEKEDIKDTVSFIVRKLAHFSIYFVGGVLIWGCINTFELKTRNKIILTILLGTLYAISDEIHQLFVPGRAGQIKDVFIDALGVSFGTLAGCLILKKGEKKIGRNRHKTNVPSNME